ncbi:MAG TPA: multiheme c-type cytochrome [Anaeromyxobacteraceae bacterium]|nr:multiheme c-type cytochrome [Anaeromyxobacteraceae bacterium]
MAHWRSAIRLLTLVGALGAARAAAPPQEPVRFWPSATCAGCHRSQVEQHFQSHHERSFTSPLFQAQYFEMVLPRASRDPAIAADARNCTACHSPVSYANERSLATSAGVTDPSLAGVTCDLCHTIVGYDGKLPQNGNFVVSPGPIKYGPYRKGGSHHGAYNDLQTTSEICAVCHEAVNAHGLRVKATFSEWKESAFAKRGVQCQDCHMSRDGVFVDGGRYESGQVSADAISHAPSRDKIYSHRFPGIHSGAPVEGAVGLRIARAPERVPAGQPFVLNVTVDNGNTAHCLPTGSADLRLLWLEVVAKIDGRPVPIPADNSARGTWGAVGENSDDALVLGGDVPQGARLYRAVYFDRRNHQTLASFDATSIAFDNRLRPGEKRVEGYTIPVPREATGTLQVEARLRYRAFPTSLAKDLDVTPPPVVEVAQASREIGLDPAPPEAPAAAAPLHLTPLERLDQLRKRRTSP